MFSKSTATSLLNKWSSLVRSYSQTMAIDQEQSQIRLISVVLVDLLLSCNSFSYQ